MTTTAKYHNPRIVTLQTQPVATSSCFPQSRSQQMDIEETENWIIHSWSDGGGWPGERRWDGAWSPAQSWHVVIETRHIVNQTFCYGLLKLFLLFNVKNIQEMSIHHSSSHYPKMKILQKWWIGDEIWDLATNLSCTLRLWFYWPKLLQSSTQYWGLDLNLESGLSIKEVKIVCQCIIQL